MADERPPFSGRFGRAGRTTALEPPSSTSSSSLLGVLAFFAAWLGALTHLLGVPTWRSDTAVLAALAGEPTLAGSVSAWLARLGTLLPLGSHTLRASLFAAFSLGLSALLVYRLSLAALAQYERTERWAHWLAFSAALTVSFSTLWIAEGTVAGGATIGGALCLWGLLLVLERDELDSSKRALLLGSVLGAVLAESPWAALALFLTSCAAWPVPKPRRALSLLAMAVATALLFWTPALLSLAPAQVSALPLLAEDAAFPPHHLLDWLGRAGFFWTVGAVLGAFLPGGDRRALLCLGLFVVLDWAIPATQPALWTQAPAVDPSRLVLHAVAVASVAPLGVAGFCSAIQWVRRLELFGARPLAALVAMLGVAAAVAGVEDAHRSLQHTPTAATSRFTDSALADLQPGAVVLTDSQVLSQRLLAAQEQGFRPDVLVVPTDRLTRARSVRRWLELEPTLETLIRDLSTATSPSERALDLLSRARPLYVEPNPTWDPRLLEHLRPGFPLCEFSTHALGRSDRLMALDDSVPTLLRLSKLTREGLVVDRATADMVDAQFERLRAVLERIGDGGALEKLDAATESLKEHRVEKAKLRAAGGDPKDDSQES